MAEQVRHALKHSYRKPRADWWRNAELVWVLHCSGINPLEVYSKSSYPLYSHQYLTRPLEMVNDAKVSTSNPPLAPAYKLEGAPYFFILRDDRRIIESAPPAPLSQYVI